MPDIKYDEIGQLVLKKRGKMGIRAAAAEIGTSPATLSRIERGKVADADTLRKVFFWLKVNPNDFFGHSEDNFQKLEVQIAFKNKRTVPQETATSLSELIQKASIEFSKKIDSIGH